jgi:hypothetical protein
MVSWVLRILVAAGLLGSAWIHYDLWQGGFSDIAVIGPLFLVNVIAGVVIAVGVLAWSHWIPPLLAVGFGAATLGAYFLSVTVGLFGVTEEFRSAAEIWGLITETGCVLFGIGLLLALRPARSREGVNA